jgi:glycosyltransferase involved in cell wall biosynthesis
MVKAIDRLLDNPRLAEALGAQARRDAITFFAADRLAAETVEIYQRAIHDFDRRR